MKFVFLTIFRKLLISIFVKILPVGDELFHADGRTDRRDEANSRFSQICDHAYNHRILQAIEICFHSTFCLIA